MHDNTHLLTNRPFLVRRAVSCKWCHLVNSSDVKPCVMPQLDDGQTQCRTLPSLHIFLHSQFCHFCFACLLSIPLLSSASWHFNYNQQLRCYDEVQLQCVGQWIWIFFSNVQITQDDSSCVFEHVALLIFFWRFPSICISRQGLG